MRKTLTTFVVAMALTASAFAASAQEQTTLETGEMMQNDDAMQSGMMDGDMAGMMKMMAEMKPMMEACTEMMASMTENMDGGMMPSPNSDG